MSGKTILFITTRFPFPAVSGRKTSLYHYCRIIKKLGYNLVVASFSDDFNVEDKPEFIDDFIVLPKISAKTKLLNIIKYSFIKRKYPLQVSLYYDKKIKKLINDVVVSKNVNIVIADMVRTTEYLLDLNVDTIIADLDDRLSLRYRRQLECSLVDANPYGLFLNSLPKILQKILLITPIKKFVMKNEINLLDKYEIYIGNITNKTIFVAKSESDSFNRQLGQKKAITVPIGVDVDYFVNKDNNANKENYIGFLGVLNVAHNESAIKHFVNDIFPKVLKKNKKAKFLIIGGGATAELKKLASKNVIFTGRVDDVRDYLSQCKVFVCPLTFGSGIKTKNLEAMSMELPVVTSYIGAENIDAINGKDWFVADSNEDFAEKIVYLLENDKERNKMAKNGSNFVRKNFTWEIAEKEFKKIL